MAPPIASGIITSLNELESTLFAEWIGTITARSAKASVAFLPDVLRLDTDVTFANRGVLRYVYNDTTLESPLICSPGTGSRPRTYCGGRRFGEDAIRFLYSQIFLGSVGSIQPNLDTVQDDGLAVTAILTTFPYLKVPAP